MNVGDEELAVMREQEAGWPQTSSSARGPANEHPKMFRKKSEHFQEEIKKRFSLVHLVWQNTEELISWPFAGLYKIRLLLRDRMRTKNLRN